MTKLIVAFRSFPSAPKNVLPISAEPYSDTLLPSETFSEEITLSRLLTISAVLKTLRKYSLQKKKLYLTEEANSIEKRRK